MSVLVCLWDSDPVTRPGNEGPVGPVLGFSVCSNLGDSELIADGADCVRFGISGLKVAATAKSRGDWAVLPEAVVSPHSAVVSCSVTGVAGFVDDKLLCFLGGDITTSSPMIGLKD